MEEKNNNDNNFGIPTDSETGEVLWDDKALAWFDKWGVEELED
jgi:hypothetical protein